METSECIREAQRQLGNATCQKYGYRHEKEACKALQGTLQCSRPAKALEQGMLALEQGILTSWVKSFWGSPVYTTEPTTVISIVENECMFLIGR